MRISKIIISLLKTKPGHYIRSFGLFSFSYKHGTHPARRFKVCHWVVEPLMQARFGRPLGLSQWGSTSWWSLLFAIFSSTRSSSSFYSLNLPNHSYTPFSAGKDLTVSRCFSYTNKKKKIRLYIFTFRIAQRKLKEKFCRFRTFHRPYSRHHQGLFGGKRRMGFLLAIIAVCSILVLLSYFGRNSSYEDPMLDPFNNPNIRVEQEKI